MADGNDSHLRATPERAQPGLNLFRVGGIQIAVDLSWLVIFTLVLWSLSAGYFPSQYPGYSRGVYWLTGLGATILFFASVLIHELSHSFVGNALGQEVRRITLFIFGGMAHLSGEPDTPGAEFKIAAVGPLTSLVLGGLFWLLSIAAASAFTQPLAEAVFHYLAVINVALAVFNLLPGFPLDGGRLLRAYFWKRTGSLFRATEKAADWGAGIAMGIMVLGGLQIFAGALIGGLWLILIGMFLRGAARASFYGVALGQSLRGIEVGDIMVTNPVSIDAETTVAEAIDDYFLQHGFAAYPIVAAGQVRGLLTLEEVRACPVEERRSRSVTDVAVSLSDVAIPASMPVSEALQVMNRAGRGRLVVVGSGERLEGMLTRSHVMRYVQVRNALAGASAA